MTKAERIDNLAAAVDAMEQVTELLETAINMDGVPVKELQKVLNAAEAARDNLTETLEELEDS